ncbi:CAMK protein kinase [Polytolypa hystricis UAMH7299]|uniref:CAMK protein kinase n=1 Tax=Polytolypa hystricis (strain UAMH7299) TaxID=1447883 RepID=A0A2B7YRK0_POLH7|nr:CAMK protein kinase [Polytolypa hystricis UAMH7299]
MVEADTRQNAPELKTTFHPIDKAPDQAPDIVGHAAPSPAPPTLKEPHRDILMPDSPSIHYNIYPGQCSTTACSKMSEPQINRDPVPRLDCSATPRSPSPATAAPRTPSLQIRTDLPTIFPTTTISQRDGHFDYVPRLRNSSSTASLPRRAPSFRTALAATHSSAGSLSPGSVFSSPQLAALNDITPLPSPILLGNSPWKAGISQSLSRASSTASLSGSTFNIRRIESSDRSRSSTRRKPYGGVGAPTSNNNNDNNNEQRSTTSHPTLEPGSQQSKHSRNRSLSDYAPHPPPVAMPRKATVSGSTPTQATPPSQDPSLDNSLQREEYLAVQRGIALPAVRPPTPPRSLRSGYDSSDTDIPSIMVGPTTSQAPTYTVRSIRTRQPRTYRSLRQLGQGTFSQVVLAVREVGEGKDGVTSSSPPRLVAVKIVNYGPAGGADAERVEVSLNREVEILRSIDHPSIVQLKAFGSDKKRALLVLDYCPGGDLFDVASQGVNQLEPSVIRRIFAELVGAVRYLHQNYIVHRDIKLENVLVNITPAAMEGISDWRTYPRALITLSDLGLSRRIPQPPESPLLHTRCGSEDYAAPEILMGQPYDGRSTDGWALGVLLYAIMESRLPFDALPGTRGDPAKLRARTPHRIARCEWGWYRFADEDGEWDPAKGVELEGARSCVEGLLKRNSRRISLDAVAKTEWVKDAIELPDGLRRGDIEVP